MRMRATALLVSGLLLGPAAHSQQQPPPAANAQAPPFFLNGASLIETIDILARTLKINYILDPAVKGGSVTINTYGEMKVSDLRPILETILRMNHLSMVQVGNLYRIVPIGDSTRLPIHPQVNIKDFPDDEQMLLNMVFLKFMTATEMLEILKPFVGESASVQPYPPANLLMIQDNSRNMKRTMELINLFDSDQFAGQRVQTFSTQNAKPSDLAKELDTVFKAYALSEKTSAVKFLPIDRINTLLAVASNPGIFKDVADWVAKLDVPVKPPAGAVDNYVYKLKYGRAENIGDVISQLYGGASRAGSYGQYNQAGTRSSGAGFIGSSSGGVAGQFGGGSAFNGSGGSTFNGLGGSNFGGGTAGIQAAPIPQNSLAGAFGGTAAAGTAPAGAATPATGTDLTGQYLGAETGVGRAGGLPRIIPNPYDNTLLVQATPQQWAQIQKLLDQLDVPPRQVLIDAKIYELDLTGSLAFGLEAFLQQKGNTSVANTLQLLGQSSAGLSLTAGLLVGQSRQLLGALNLSEVRGKEHIISAPSIIATDSIPASINVGTTVPTLSAQAVSPITSAGTSSFTQAITNQSTGVALQILARVNASGIVTMVIDQSVSAPGPTSPETSGSSINSPSFSQREVSTQVTVQDGDTIAIGGIILEQQSLTTSGIPFLDRIPYIGPLLFATSSYSKTRTELIIFLTPRVIYDTNQISEATEDLRQKVKSLTKEIKER
jgi:general secretion pathway protein D